MSGAIENHGDETSAVHWLSRRELADRLGLPVKTLAEWASKGTGPRYAKFGKHTRYKLGDVIEWENGRMIDRPA